MLLCHGFLFIMDGLTQYDTESIQREAAVATFLYDALLRREGELSQEVVATANAFPKAAALAEAEAWASCYYSSALPREAPNRSVTVSRISVVPCAQAAAKASVILARIAIFLAAMLTTVATAVAFYTTEGIAIVQGVATRVLGISESRMLQVLDSLQNGDTNDSATRLVLQTEKVIASARPIRALPNECVPYVIIAVFFLLGVIGGLLLVQGALTVSYICGFLVGIVSCNFINLCLQVSGGLTCKVTRRRTLVPTSTARDGLRMH